MKTTEEKFESLHEKLDQQFDALSEGVIDIGKAKAFAALAKQINNVLALQVETAKFKATNEKSDAKLREVGLR